MTRGGGTGGRPVRIVSIGEILWDLVGGAEHLGGAPFNFAVHARRLGHEVVFVSAVGEDERGRRALAAVERLGLPPRFVQRAGGAATGIVTVELDGAGQPSFTIHRPAAYDVLRLSPSDLAELSSWRPDWISFGTLFASHPASKAELERVIAACPGARCFYDVNLRAGCYTVALVRELMARASVVKLNEDETAALDRMDLEAWCRRHATEFGWEAVCVTRGAAGCALLVGDTYVEAAGCPVVVKDTIGAGDAFAAAFLHGLEQGWDAARIADFANRVGAVVASRAGGTPEWTLAEVLY